MEVYGTEEQTISLKLHRKYSVEIRKFQNKSTHTVFIFSVVYDKSYLWFLLLSPRCHFVTSVSHRCLQRSRQLPGCTNKVRTPQAWGEGRCSYPAGTAHTTPWCSWPPSLNCWTQWHHAWCAVNQTETLYWLSVLGHGGRSVQLCLYMNKVTSCTSILTASLYSITRLCQIYLQQHSSIFISQVSNNTKNICANSGYFIPWRPHLVLNILSNYFRWQNLYKIQIFVLIIVYLNLKQQFWV